MNIDPVSPGQTNDIDAARRSDVARARRDGDETSLRSWLSDPSARVRAASFSALVAIGRATPTDAQAAISDSNPDVRRSACEHGSRLPRVDLVPLLDDPDFAVVEAAAYTLGEQESRRAVDGLVRIARTHEDPLCRESAIAALGAIGEPRAKTAVLAALADIPAIRRRAVIALAAFDGDEVERALPASLNDRDWQVRQAAEELLD